MLRPYEYLPRRFCIAGGSPTVFSSDRENQKSRPFEKCAQDESLRDSRDGPGATKGGACKGFLQADYRRMALKEPLSMRRATSAMSGARERSASTAGETFLTMS